MRKYLKVVVFALFMFLLSACADGTIDGVTISLVTSEDGTYTLKSETTQGLSNAIYNWDFGGRVNQPAQSSVANPVISYIEEGDYAVSLTVEVNGKVLTSNIINISYYQPVKVVINYNDKTIFDNNQLGGAVTDKKLYIWNDEIKDATYYNINNELIKDLALTRQSYIVLTESGKIYTYGDNSYGTLGDNTTNSRKEFKVVEALNGVFIKKIYTGLNTVFAIDDNGRVYSWGNNDKGLLGIGSNEGSIMTPTQITELNNIINLAVGYETVLALDKDGQVYSWGDNSMGQLGIDNTTTMKSPVKIEAFADKVITSIYVDGSTDTIAFAIDKEGKLYGWGSNWYNNLGLNIVNNKVPNIIEGLDDKFIVSIATNRYNTVWALDGDGKVYSWGRGIYGLLGHGNDDDLSEPKLIEYFSNNNIVIRKIISKGRTESVYAIDTNGKMYSWGDNGFGQLGIDDYYYLNQTLPVQVSLLNDYKIVYIVNGSSSTFAVSNTGKVFVAGNNFDGEFGMSNITDPLSNVFIEMTTIPALK